eukprot:329677-Chlamydomonas_euryale.AAC.8
MHNTKLPLQARGRTCMCGRGEGQAFGAAAPAGHFQAADAARRVRASMSAKPSRLAPRHAVGDAASGWLSLSPMPQVVSLGLASTSTQFAVPSSHRCSAVSLLNFSTLPLTTISKRAASHTLPSKPRTPRPSCRATRGLGSARMACRYSSSSNSRALPAIIQCSAVEYTCPSAGSVKGRAAHCEHTQGPKRDSSGCAAGSSPPGASAAAAAACPPPATSILTLLLMRLRLTRPALPLRPGGSGRQKKRKRGRSPDAHAAESDATSRDASDRGAAATAAVSVRVPTTASASAAGVALPGRRALILSSSWRSRAEALLSLAVRSVALARLRSVPTTGGFGRMGGGSGLLVNALLRASETRQRYNLGRGL